MSNQLISKQDEKVTCEAALIGEYSFVYCVVCYWYNVIISSLANSSGQNEQLMFNTEILHEMQSRISELEEQLKMKDDKIVAIHDNYELIKKNPDTEPGEECIGPV